MFKEIILKNEVHIKILGKILITYSVLFSNENNIIWNHLNLGLTCMQKVLEECKNEYEICLEKKVEKDNLRLYVELNDNLMRFIEELVYKISSKKQNLKELFEKYINDIIQYINKTFSNRIFKPLDDYVISCLNILIDIISLYNKKAVNLIDNNSINNLYFFAVDTKDNTIISFKKDLQDSIEAVNQNNMNNSINESIINY